MRMFRIVLIRVGLVVGLTAVVLAIVLLRPTEPSNTAEGEWTCSMHPQVRRDRPGRCPNCGMDLIPVAQLSQEQTRIENRAGVYAEPVAYRELFKEIRTVGKIDYSERQVAFITARFAGRVQRVFADVTGMHVKKNFHLVSIYSSELQVTIQSLLDSLRDNNQVYVDLARERLRRWSISPEQIQEIEKSGKGQSDLTIHAPIGGTVIEKSVREGQYVKEGDVLYRIADLDPIWLYLDIYEYDLGWVRIGQAVNVTVEAYPGEKFPGRVMFVDPFLDDKTRTLRARVNLPNPARKLKAGMYAAATLRVKLRSDGSPEPTGLEGKYVCPMHPEVVSEKEGACRICDMPLDKVLDQQPLPVIHKGPKVHEHNAARPEVAAAPSGKVLAIPSSAVLDTGRRQVAYRQSRAGAYELVALDLGPRADGKDDQGNTTSYFAVLGGVKAGDRVVLRGAFLLDSQRQIEGMPSLLYPEGQAGVNVHSGHGPAPSPKTKDSIEHKH